MLEAASSRDELQRMTLADECRRRASELGGCPAGEWPRPTRPRSCPPVLVSLTFFAPSLLLAALCVPAPVLSLLMARSLLADGRVLFAGYRMPHPLENRMLIKIKTRPGHKSDDANAQRTAHTELATQANARRGEENTGRRTGAKAVHSYPRRASHRIVV